MPEFVRVPLDGGEDLRIEVDVRDENGWTRAGRAQDTADAVSRTLQEALAPIRPGMQAIVDHLRGGITPPDTIKLEFGIKFSADAGMVVARTAAEANFSVAVEWNRPSDR